MSNFLSTVYHRNHCQFIKTEKYIMGYLSHRVRKDSVETSLAPDTKGKFLVSTIVTDQLQFSLNQPLLGFSQICAVSVCLCVCVLAAPTLILGISYWLKYYPHTLRDSVVSPMSEFGPSAHLQFKPAVN